MIEITDKTKCCGCGACACVCPKHSIEMLADEKGFLYPQIDKTICINCGLCNKTCPIINNKENSTEKIAYAAYNTDDVTRKASSSGGMFGLIAKNIINKGGVVFGAAFKSDYKSVYHKGVERLEDLPLLYGSKYLQSETGDSFKQVENYLKCNRYVLFVGTSCQIAGLKNYLCKDYEKLITVDVICHGTPSPKIWQDYVISKEKNGTHVIGVNFRNKRFGWSKSVLLLLLLSDGTEYCKVGDKDRYIQGFLSNLYLRDSCYNCHFRGEKVLSDISLGDFWGIDNVLPNFNDNKGVSAVIINTEKGLGFFEMAKSETVLHEVSYKDVLKGNPVLESSVVKPKKSDKFWQIYHTQGLDKAYKSCLKNSFFKRCYSFVRRACGKVKTIIFRNGRG